MFRIATAAVAVLIIAPTAEFLMADTPKAPDLPEIAAPDPDPNAAEFGRKIPRTMGLLAGSTPQRRHPVHIVFYGQSITVQAWWEAVAAHLARKYPHADLTVENLAIGGYGISRLRRTAEHDIYPLYPDLIVLHAYGVGKGNLESMVKAIRSRTTAEIVLWTHHVCTYKRRQGMTDERFEKAFAAHQKRRDDASEEIRRVAKEYGGELIEIREPWKAYLKKHDIDPKEFLSDHIHLNKKGMALMAALMKPHFRHDADFRNPWSETIKTVPVKPDDRGRVKLDFEGNRIDVVAGELPEGGKAGTAKILIDGRAPSENPRLYAITRPSKAPHAWWPAVNRVGHEKPLVLEDWTVRITSFSADPAVLEFAVSGSKTGPDGQGKSTERFVSKSGRVVIEPQDWAIHGAVKWMKKPMPEDFEVTWSVVPLFADEYTPPQAGRPGQVLVTALAKGLVNGNHTLEIIPNGDGPVPVAAVRVHEPPLKEAGEEANE